jgi:hypothetical protein
MVSGVVLANANPLATHLAGVEGLCGRFPAPIFWIASAITSTLNSTVRRRAKPNKHSSEL